MKRWQGSRRWCVPAAVVLGATAAMAAAQEPGDPDAVALVEAAAEAVKGMRTLAYKGHAEETTGSRSRVTTGRVLIERFDYSDRIGGRLSFSGEVTAQGRAPRTFAAAYDGQLARRLRDDQKRLLTGDVYYGGDTILLAGPGKSLLLDELLAELPFEGERSAKASYGGVEEVGGVPCHVVAVEYDKPETKATFYLGVGDSLPRRVVRHYRSSRGRAVTADLTLTELEIDSAIDEAVFTLEKPEGYEIEVVGRRPPPPLDVGDMAPDFTLADENGVKYTLSDFRGQVVVLDFWATWCRYCQKAMPALQRLHDRYAGRGAVVLTINCRDGSDADPVGYVRSRGYTYPVLPNGNSIAPMYRVQGIPAFYVVAPNGRVVYKGTGFGDDGEQRLARLIEENLAK